MIPGPAAYYQELLDNTDLPIPLPLDATLDRPVLGLIVAMVPLRGESEGAAFGLLVLGNAAPGAIEAFTKRAGFEIKRQRCFLPRQQTRLALELFAQTLVGK